MDNILFLTEAGDGIGLGHLTRCLALQTFFLNNYSYSKILLNLKGKRYFKYDANIQCINWLKEIKKVKIYAIDYKIAIVDSYIASPEFYSFLKTIFEKVIAIDDYNRIVYPVDLILNPNIFCNKLDYSNQFVNIIGGRDFVILRDSILEKGQEFIVKKNIQKLIITLGGNDYRNLLPVIVNSLKIPDFKIDIIAGTEDYKKRLQNLLSKNNITFFGYTENCKMASLLFDADIVISGAGQTLNELAYLGVPTISICVDDDQKFNIQAFYENGFLLDTLFWNDKDLINKLSEILIIMNNQKLRLKLSNIGKGLVNGNGIKNICNNIYRFVMDNN